MTKKQPVADPKNSVDLSHQWLLLYAHAIAFIHGIGFLLQGSLIQEGLIKYALTDQNMWHGGLPALSLFPVSFSAGLATVLLTTLSVVMILRPKKSIWSLLLPVIIFMTGGGFVFFYIALITTISLLIRPKHEKPLIKVRQWLLSMLLGWFFLSWLLGWMFPSLMFGISSLTFVLFDLLLPLMIVLTNHFPGWVSNRRR